jgi:hypothetical protein
MWLVGLKCNVYDLGLKVWIFWIHLVPSLPLWFFLVFLWRILMLGNRKSGFIFQWMENNCWHVCRNKTMINKKPSPYPCWLKNYIMKTPSKFQGIDYLWDWSKGTVLNYFFFSLKTNRCRTTTLCALHISCNDKCVHFICRCISQFMSNLKASFQMVGFSKSFLLENYALVFFWVHMRNLVLLIIALWDWRMSSTVLILIYSKILCLIL